MKYHKIFPVFVSIFILILSQISPLQAAAKVQYSIVYTNDVMGEVEPCG
jgi:hypothetical protein